MNIYDIFWWLSSNGANYDVWLWLCWLYGFVPSMSAVGSVWGLGSALLLAQNYFRHGHFIGTAKGLGAAIFWPLLLAAGLAKGTFEVAKESLPPSKIVEQKQISGS